MLKTKEEAWETVRSWKARLLGNTEQNGRSLVTKPRAMQIIILIWVKQFSEERWEKSSMQHVISSSFTFFCKSFCKSINNCTDYSWYP